RPAPATKHGQYDPRTALDDDPSLHPQHSRNRLKQRTARLPDTAFRAGWGVSRLQTEDVEMRIARHRNETAQEKRRRDRATAPERRVVEISDTRLNHRLIRGPEGHA